MQSCVRPVSRHFYMTAGQYGDIRITHCSVGATAASSIKNPGFNRMSIGDHGNFGAFWKLNDCSPHKPI